MPDATVRTLSRRYAEAPSDEAAHALAAAVARAPSGTAFGIITIPTIGSRLTLAADWKFTLHGERRNTAFWAKVHQDEPKDEEMIQVPDDSRWGWHWGYIYDERETVLPAGTVLRIDRIYIRKGDKDKEYDSVTFIVESMPGQTGEQRPFEKKGKVVGRFWAKLGDVNRILCEWEDSTVPRDVAMIGSKAKKVREIEKRRSLSGPVDSIEPRSDGYSRVVVRVAEDIGITSLVTDEFAAGLKVGQTVKLKKVRTEYHIVE